MAITIVATPGSATANSFATEAEFIANAALAPNVPTGTTVSGSTATEDEKKALVRATKTLSALPWDGSRTDATQVLSFPRTDVYNLDDPDHNEYDDDELPAWLVEATAELALSIRRAGTTNIDDADTSAGIIRERVGPLETEWESASSRPVGLSRFPRVLELIERYLTAETRSLEVQRS